MSNMFKFQGQLKFNNKRTANAILNDVRSLMAMHGRGDLGGSIMPEDQNPGYLPGSDASYQYFTLPMALNYQRNSYKLWEAAKKTAEDKETRVLFDPRIVSTKMTTEQIRSALSKYKLGLQPNKHTHTWQRLCFTINDTLDGSIKNLFVQCDYDTSKILEFIRHSHKSMFPYLSGEKISNYWLYVMNSYTDANLKRRDCLSVAPDTHVIQASIVLGLVTAEEMELHDARQKVSDAWRQILKHTNLDPIDIHTPLWLWSRGGFRDIVA